MNDKNVIFSIIKKDGKIRAARIEREPQEGECVPALSEFVDTFSQLIQELALEKDMDITIHVDSKADFVIVEHAKKSITGMTVMKTNISFDTVKFSNDLTKWYQFYMKHNVEPLAWFAVCVKTELERIIKWYKQIPDEIEYVTI